MYKAIVETASFVKETDAMLALAFPGDYVGHTVNADRVDVVQASDDWSENGHGGSGNIRAEARTSDETYSIDISVKFPGFIKSAMAKVFSREPRAIVYTSVYCERE